jgi:ornithine carbamoyltransferase
MPPFVLHAHLLVQHALPAPQAHALLQAALALREAERAGRPQPLLRGKNIAILGPGPDGIRAGDDPSATGGLADAATRLGARVAHIRPDDTLLSGDDTALARMLSRLYDAVAVDSSDGQFALRLQRDTGLPVFEGLERPDHPVAAQLLPAMEAGDPVPQGREENRRCLVQALLLASLA